MQNKSKNEAPQRKYPRKAFPKPIAYLCNGVSSVVTGVEIGEGGLSFDSDQNIPVDQAIVVNFFVPEGDFFSMQTAVKNAVPQDNGRIVYGVHFLNMSLSLKRQIRAYVARMSLNEKKLN
jgi:c-di-GMP-binding flagellar brake protein YcgR